MIKRISPKEAHELMQQGYVYVDVRSAVEYEASHPEGAVNIPIMHRGAAGMSPNAEFVKAFEAAYPPGSKVVLGCQGGNRSIRAAQILEGEGYDDLIECRTGFGGARDAMGRVLEPGWADAGLPCEAGNPAGRGWESVRGKIG